MAGLEVEEMRPVAPPFSGVVVGEIVATAPHPDADRLQVCQVDVGQGAPLNIVCGAANARVGIRVPCALPGAQLPPGADGQAIVIRKGKLRGVESEGMLCSARELGLSDDHAGLLELSTDCAPGDDVRKCLDLDDTLFTLKLTPNLAHCLSVFGIAREVSALTGAPLVTPQFRAAAVAHGDRLPVKVSAPDLCGRFTGRIVRGVNTRAATPNWMVDRLARCGQRSVSPLVDISNYVMFELGRPSHIFDLDKIHGGLDVRWGRPGEQLELLNGTTVAVDSAVGVIADDDEVESLAGIMGGAATAVSDDTRHVFVEAAFWWPKAIAGRSRRFNFSTDAGHRFERGVDPGCTVEHVERITQLILDICGGAAGPLDDLQPNMPVSKPVAMRVARAAKVIGMPLSQAQCAGALRNLGLEVTEEVGIITVQPPSWRFDLQIEEDLIEEVARIIGYENLPTTAPLAPLSPKIGPEAVRGPFAVRRLLAGLGYQETINFSFVEQAWERDLAGNQDPVRLVNPIASQMAVMRSSLIASLLNVVRFNLDRKADSVRIFEIGRVFLKDASVADTDHTVEGYHQPMRVACMAAGAARPIHWEGGNKSGTDFYDIKGDLEALLAPAKARFEPATHPAMHPGRCARVVIGGVDAGFVGELHPRWRQSWGLARAPVMFELELDAVLARTVPVFQGVARHQPVERDLALIVPEAVTHAQLMLAVRKAPTGGLVQDAVLFDVYRPRAGADSDAAPVTQSGLVAGEKSLAVRFMLNRDNATLTDAEIESAMSVLEQTLNQQLGARLRS